VAAGGAASAGAPRVRGRDGASRTFVSVARKRTCFAMAMRLNPVRLPIRILAEIAGACANAIAGPRAA